MASDAIRHFPEPHAHRPMGRGTRRQAVHIDRRAEALAVVNPKPRLLELHGDVGGDNSPTPNCPEMCVRDACSMVIGELNAQP